MALIACPNCSKRISDKAESCEHCGQVLTGLDEEKLKSLKRVKIVKKSQSLMNQSLIAILMFCGGFAFMYWDEPFPDSWQYMAANASIFIGFVWYIITRIQMIVLKRK